MDHPGSARTLLLTGSSSTRKQFTCERLERAVRKDASPGSGGVEAEYTHTRAGHPKSSERCMALSNDQPPCLTGGPRANPSERKAGPGKEMKLSLRSRRACGRVASLTHTTALLVSMLIRHSHQPLLQNRGNNTAGSCSLNIPPEHHPANEAFCASVESRASHWLFPHDFIYSQKHPFEAGAAVSVLQMRKLRQICSRSHSW